MRPTTADVYNYCRSRVQEVCSDVAGSDDDNLKLAGVSVRLITTVQSRINSQLASVYVNKIVLIMDEKSKHGREARAHDNHATSVCAIRLAICELLDNIDITT